MVEGKTVKKSSILRARQFLRQAIDNDDTTTIKRILDVGFPLDQSLMDYPFITALMYASSEGKENALNTIISYNPDAKTADSSGRNVLHMTVRSGQMGTLGIILADPKFECLHESRTIGGITPLMAAL